MFQHNWQSSCVHVFCISIAITSGYFYVGNVLLACCVLFICNKWWIVLQFYLWFVFMFILSIIWCFLPFCWFFLGLLCGLALPVVLKYWVMCACVCVIHLQNIFTDIAYFLRFVVWACIACSTEILGYVCLCLCHSFAEYLHWYCIVSIINVFSCFPFLCILMMFLVSVMFPYLFHVGLISSVYINWSCT
jgi:hypothetical protein